MNWSRIDSISNVSFSLAKKAFLQPFFGKSVLQKGEHFRSMYLGKFAHTRMLHALARLPNAERWVWWMQMSISTVTSKISFQADVRQPTRKNQLVFPIDDVAAQKIQEAIAEAISAMENLTQERVTSVTFNATDNQIRRGHLTSGGAVYRQEIAAHNVSTFSRIFSICMERKSRAEHWATKYPKSCLNLPWVLAVSEYGQNEAMSDETLLICSDVYNVKSLQVGAQFLKSCLCEKFLLLQRISFAVAQDYSVKPGIPAEPGISNVKDMKGRVPKPADWETGVASLFPNMEGRYVKVGRMNCFLNSRFRNLFYGTKSDYSLSCSLYGAAWECEVLWDSNLGFNQESKAVRTSR